MMSRCFTGFPISVLGEPNIYQNLGDFTWRVSDCEELVGGYLQEMMGGCFRGFLLFYSIHILIKDVSVFVVICSVP